MAKKILIVDDEKELVEMLEMRLSVSGYEIVKAYDGEAGLAKARDEKPDLIILDVMMPKMNGYEVCRFLKFDDDFKNIPIIMLTARGQETDKELGINVGANDYITKPFNSAELLKKVESFIGK